MKIQSARRHFLTSWGTYADKLQLLLKQQLEEQEKTLADFNQRESKWQQQLMEANRDLAAFSAQAEGVAQPVSSDSDMDVKTEPPQDDPWGTESAAKLKDQQAELTAALTKAKEKAETASREAEHQRERKPRHKDRTEAEGKGVDPPPAKAPT